jgi:hypothetical protein
MPTKRKTNASTRKTNASTRKTNASTRKTNASTRKTNASTRKTNASTRKTNASTRKTSANKLNIRRIPNNNAKNQIRLIEELEQKYLSDTNGVVIFHKTNRSSITVKMIRHNIYYTGAGAKNDNVHTPDEFKEIMFEHFENDVKNKSLDEMVEWSGACYGNKANNCS